MSDLSFLIGSWSSDNGVVSDTGGTSRGTSVITSEVGGKALLRRDQTTLFNRDGKQTGSFDQLMMIYADGRAVRADYTDGQHVIHYTSAVVVPGKSVIFRSAPGSAPVFELSYEVEGGRDTLQIKFGMFAPGHNVFQPIATGTVHRTP
jgi:hypothetical protein